MKAWEKIAAFAFGVSFISVMLYLAGAHPNPTEFQIFVYRVVLSTAAAGVGAVLPGFITVKVSTWARAGGAMAMFLLVFETNPPVLVTDFTPFAVAMQRGEAALAQNGLTLARNFFSLAQQARPDSWLPYDGLARVEDKAGNRALALNDYKEAFKRTGERDGTLAYAIAMEEDDLRDLRSSKEYLSKARQLLPDTAPILSDVVFDTGLVNLMSWIESGTPKQTQDYTDANLAFDEFLQRRGWPSHWALYNQACLHATRATDISLDSTEREKLKSSAIEQLKAAVSQLVGYASVKAPVQRRMMKTLIESPESWHRETGEPIACPALIELMNQSGRSKTLLAPLGP